MNDHPQLARRLIALFGLLAATPTVIWTIPGGEQAVPRARAADSSGYSHTTSWSATGYLKELVQPIDVALADDGRLYVADGRSGLVLVFRDIDPRPIETWEPAAELAAKGDFVVPRAIEIDRARFQVGLLWQAGETRFVEIRTLDGAPVAGPWQAPAAEAQDLAFDPDSGDVLLPAPATCRVYRLRPADGLLVDRFSITDLGCEAVHIAALPGKLAVIQTDNGAHLIDAGTGRRIGGYGLSGYRPLDVAINAQSRVHVLVRAPPTRQPPSDALVLVFGTDRRLERTLTAPEAELPALPWDSLWPWALDVAADRLAVTSTEDHFIAAVRSLDGSSGWSVVGDEAQRQYSPGSQGGGTGTGTGNSGAMSLAMAPDRRLVLLDESLPKLILFAPDGGAGTWASRPAGAREVAVAADGTSYATTAQDRVLRFDGKGTVAWTKSCTCGYGGGQLAVAGDRVFVGSPRRQGVAMLDTGTGRDLGVLKREGAGEIGWWPADLAIAGDLLITADMAGSRLATWSLEGLRQADWPAGVFDGPYRTAAGKLADGRTVIAALMTDGHVEIYAAATGQLVDRWLPRLGDGTAFDVADLAMDETGRIFLADAGSRQVHVFEAGGVPEPGTPPPDLASPTPPATLPTPSAAACRVSGDKVAGPARIRLGETAVVTLTLRTDCPAQARTTGADIVLLMDVSSSMTGPAFDAAQAAAVTFVLNTDAAANRVGVVAFSDRAIPIHELTGELGKVVEQLETLNVVTRDGDTDVNPALEMADLWLRDELRPGAQPVVILLTDGRFGGPLDPQPVAGALRRRGVDIYAIGLGRADQDTLLGIAGRPDRFFFAPSPADLAPIYREIRRLVAASAAGQVLIDDTMGEQIAVVPGSASPPAVEGADRLRWGFSALPRAGITLTYHVQPQAPGRRPTNRLAFADYVDGDGIQRRFVFPVPEIEVVAGSPTPTASETSTPLPTSSPSQMPSPMPTATATPTRRPTRTARPTAVPRPIYLPLVQRDPGCTLRRRPIEVAVVLDASSSMLATTTGGETKLAAAVRAAETFILQLDPAADRAAVVAFNHDARVVQGLTGDRARIRAALRRITTATETRIDLGIEAGHRALVVSPRWGSAASVMIVLTDGRANPVPADVAVTRALAAQRDKITLFTIGLGADLDFDALLRMASRPSYFYRAADAGDLVDIYRAIAVQLPCTPGR